MFCFLHCGLLSPSDTSNYFKLYAWLHASNLDMAKPCQACIPKSFSHRIIDGWLYPHFTRVSTFFAACGPHFRVYTPLFIYNLRMVKPWKSAIERRWCMQCMPLIHTLRASRSQLPASLSSAADVPSAVNLDTLQIGSPLGFRISPNPFVRISIYWTINTS